MIIIFYGFSSFRFFSLFYLFRCVPGCKQYDYDRSLYGTTIVTEFGLICEKAWFVSACASIYQVGYAFSSIIVGYSSDFYGRKVIFQIKI